MSRNIFIEQVVRTPVEEQRVELVERKGVGHPDSLADGIADAVSRALCREYLEEFGYVMHHNTDQVELVGGQAEVEFGDGKVIKPIYILLSGRATTVVDEKVVPVHKVAIKAAKDYLRTTVRNLDVESDVIVDSRIGQGSVDLIDVFRRSKAVPLANDTSFGVGFAPLSDVERLCYQTERYLNSDEFKKRFPESGEDIKVMGLREGEGIALTISMAMVARYVPDMDHYLNVIQEIKAEVKKLASRITEREVEVFLNTGDDYKRKAVYLTATGTSTEMGDDGSVGRGNRVNGLITPNRHMSMEAAAGKNPVNHVGKIYNLLAHRVAEQITREIAGVREVDVRLLSQIGKPIDQPKAASVQLILEEGVSLGAIESDIFSIVDENIASIRKITDMFIRGELTTF
ncbi:methionine adenosyltransferase [Candidatus Pyrohabitans sp.]